MEKFLHDYGRRGSFREMFIFLKDLIKCLMNKLEEINFLENYLSYSSWIIDLLIRDSYFWVIENS